MIQIINRIRTSFFPKSTNCPKSTNKDSQVFKKVKGTPKFWQQKRYNLLAMINVLGPFQWFFTFSCAELRWPSIIACILRKKGHKVTVLDSSADTSNATLQIDEETLTEYLQKTNQTLRGIIQKETFLVTRIFDQRVKSFIKNILMDQGEEGMKLKHYVYRVEFQGRLAPHIHGCAWMKDEEIEKCFIDGTADYNKDKVSTLIDRFVTCEIPKDQTLKNIVDSVQTHTCSKTCRKKGPDCRFGFPDYHPIGL